MAQMLLVMGESGTGKSTSLRNCDPVTTAVVNPVGKPLPFKNHFELLNNVTDSRTIIKYIKEQVTVGKKLIVVDDFQYILSIPYFKLLNQFGWDKWNDMAYNYTQVLFDACKDLPNDVLIAFMTHTETLENGITTMKLLGKQLREKITIEGLFTIVLRTGVIEGKYYFYTQNSGKDTVKSPLGMFPAYAIDNDLNYVADKIRNFYEVGEYKTDAEMEQADASVAGEVEKPDVNGRRSRSGKGKITTETATPPQVAPEQGAIPAGRRSRSGKTHDEVVAENNQKMTEYHTRVNVAIDEAAGGAEAVDFNTAYAAVDGVPKPQLETPPRRTRKERQNEQSETAESKVLEEDTYFYIPAEKNYVMKHKGDVAPEGAEVISKEAFSEGVRRLAQAENSQSENSAEGVMNPPERGRRTRRNAEQAELQPDNTNASEQGTSERTRRTRRTR